MERQLKKDWYTPFDELRQEMDRIVDEFSSYRPPAFRFSPTNWEPLIDIYETDETVVVIMELAGIKEEDIEVLATGEVLVIRGVRGESVKTGQPRYHQIEIRRGPFNREIALPAAIDSRKTKAYYEDGILEVVMQKLGS